MDHRTQGLILRLHPYSETSLIVRWLTPDLGRIATLARGAQRAKSPLRGRLDLFYLADFNVALSRRSTLHSLREVSLSHTFPQLRRNYPALQQAAYAVQLVERFTEPDTPLPDLLALLKDYLTHLNSRGPAAWRVLAFELRLLAWSGLAPSPPPGSLTGTSRALFDQLTDAPWSTLANLEATPGQLQPIDTILRHFLIGQCDVPPATRNAAIQWDPIAPP